MIRTILFVAALAGLAAGVFAFAAQEVSQVPLILEAETYENSGVPPVPSEDAAVGEEEAWGPADGFERRFYTLVTNVLAGIGFSLLLAGAYNLTGGANWRTGLYWGLAGYITFTLAPSLGLEPELPGANAAELYHRQIWWLSTAASTGLGLALIFLARKLPWAVMGVICLSLPHIVGAPQPEVHGGLAPAELVHQYVTATLVTGLFFWAFMGTISGFLYKRFTAA